MKLNLPMPPEADDQAFLEVWPQVEALLEQHAPEFIILQAGADSIKGDPITHMSFTEASHNHAARRLIAIANNLGHGRLLAAGGGGYNRHNLANGWCAVVEGLLAP
jgi:acetoin utilization protein AcuC